MSDSKFKVPLIAKGLLSFFSKKQPDLDGGALLCKSKDCEVVFPIPEG